MSRPFNARETAREPRRDAPGLSASMVLISGTSMRLPIDDAEYQLQVICEPCSPEGRVYAMRRGREL